MLSQIDSIAVGLLIGRAVIGLLMAAHGAQKLFGWFGGYGLDGTGQFMTKLGFNPGRTFALAAGFGESVSGLLFAFGLFGPVGPSLMISVMIVAMITVHWVNGVFSMNNGIELTLLYSMAALVFAFTGYGSYSLDAMLGLPTVWPAPATLTVLALGIAGGFGNLALRRPVSSHA